MVAVHGKAVGLTSFLLAMQHHGNAAIRQEKEKSMTKRPSLTETTRASRA